MASVDLPLDWWAYGGYDEVIRQTGWTKNRARREVKKTMKKYGLNPIGHDGYEEVRRQIMAGELLNWDLQ